MDPTAPIWDTWADTHSPTVTEDASSAGVGGSAALRSSSASISAHQAFIWRLASVLVRASRVLVLRFRLPPSS